MLQFHTVNFTIHIFPCIITLIWPVEIHLLHGAIAAVLHVGWGLYVTGGTLIMDHLYVPMKAYQWRTMWLVAAVSEVTFAPFVLYQWRESMLAGLLT